MKEKLKFALHLANEAEKIILRYYQSQDLKVELKRDRTVVTDADRRAEEKIRDLIERQFPEDSIIGEEHGEKRGKSDDCWILDPVDGTQSFVCGVPLFGTLIGLTSKNVPTIGVVNFPGLNELCYALAGDGAWWRPANSAQPVRAVVSETSDPSEAIFCTTSFDGFTKAGQDELLVKARKSTGKFRGWGDCYGHMLVATGRAELMIDPLMNLWDCAALYPIVTEAGGHFFDLNGRACIDGGSAISTNRRLYEHFRSVLEI